jgi:hypothetical protein
MPPDPVTALLAKLAAHHEQISQLDTREADHHAALLEQLTEIAGLITPLRRLVQDHETAIEHLQNPGQQTGDENEQDGYQPGPPPPWWKLTATERREPIVRLRAWVEQVYRPGYGHLATTLGTCWDQHDLCLYALDILADLWSVLYLRPQRSSKVLSAQAEYQARILPALAEQLMTETMGCSHPRTLPPVPGQFRSGS